MIFELASLTLSRWIPDLRSLAFTVRDDCFGLIYG